MIFILLFLSKIFKAKKPKLPKGELQLYKIVDCISAEN